MITNKKDRRWENAPYNILQYLMEEDNKEEYKYPERKPLPIRAVKLPS